MDQEYFITTQRLGFSKWTAEDVKLATLLWGNPQVTRYICASGTFSRNDILARLQAEVANGSEFGVQYWPVFELESSEFVGCCGLRPHGEGAFEIGFHLRPEFWGRGYAFEAARAVVSYAFNTLHAQRLFAGHNPHNAASKRLLGRLGFAYTGDEFYEPTGLYHPSYELVNPNAEVG